MKGNVFERVFIVLKKQLYESATAFFYACLKKSLATKATRHGEELKSKLQLVQISSVAITDVVTENVCGVGNAKGYQLLYIAV